MIKTISMKDIDFSKKFLSSLRETGFAVIQDHGLPFGLVNDTYEYWKGFFESPASFKESLLYNHKENNQGGYFPFKSENAKDQKVSDLKEFFHYYRGGRLPINPVKYLGRLDSVSLTASPFAMMNLFEELEAVGIQLLKHINNELPNNIWSNLSMDLEVMATDSPSTLLRTIHYPPIKQSDREAGAVRAAAHEDINLITLLPAATMAGLEVLDLKGNWHSVKASGDDIVVNSGDMLELATGGFLKSTTHRVVNTPEGYETSRYSMPMFIHPWGNTKLSQDKTAEQYLIERLKEIGLK